jgi:DNA invertase Pin-like site-specific DNA recombinase
MVEKKVWLYCRTARPDEIALTGQKQKLIAYAQKHGYSIVGITAESGSGLDLEREGLKAVLAAANAQCMDMVLTVNTDRIGRNTQHVLKYRKLLKAHHIGLSTVNSNMECYSKAVM